MPTRRVLQPIRLAVSDPFSCAHLLRLLVAVVGAELAEAAEVAAEAAVVRAVAAVARSREAAAHAAAGVVVVAGGATAPLRRCATSQRSRCSSL